jgi:Protein of unknown function (DUF2924)
MPRVKSRPVAPDRRELEREVARLRDLDVEVLRARWHTVFRRRAPAHLPRHLLFRVLAYRLQADRLGDLDDGTKRLLERPNGIASKRTAQRSRDKRDLTPGTMLVREWKGEQQRVMVLAEGFAWKDKSYPSLSKVAFAITGSRWNGPRFFGLRDRQASRAERKP